MKKFAKILLACLVLLLALIAMLLGYSEWIVSDARHYTYDQVDKVPYNRVAVVLGTSKYLAGGGPNHYFKYRIKAAAELYNNASLKQHMRQRVQDQPRDFQAHLQLGIVLFKEPATAWRLFFLFTLIASLVGLKVAG